MPILRTKVNPLEQMDSKSSASKFIQFLYTVNFIAVSEKNGKLIFKFVSFKTLFNLLFVVICFYGCQIICIVAFEYESKMEWHIGTVAELLSFSLYSNITLMNLLQPIILRYVCLCLFICNWSINCNLYFVSIVLASMIWIRILFLRKTIHGPIIRKHILLVRVLSPLINTEKEKWLYRNNLLYCFLVDCWLLRSYFKI